MGLHDEANYTYNKAQFEILEGISKAIHPSSVLNNSKESLELLNDLLERNTITTSNGSRLVLTKEIFGINVKNAISSDIYELIPELNEDLFVNYLVYSGGRYFLSQEELILKLYNDAVNTVASVKLSDVSISAIKREGIDDFIEGFFKSICINHIDSIESKNVLNNTITIDKLKRKFIQE